MKPSVAATGARQQSSCPWCGEKFKSKNKLKKHIGDDHKQEHAQSRQATAQTAASDDLQQTVQTTASDDLQRQSDRQPSDRLPSDHKQPTSQLPSDQLPSDQLPSDQLPSDRWQPTYQPYDDKAIQLTPFAQVLHPDHYTQSQPYHLYGQYWPQPYGWWQGVQPAIQPATQSILPAEQQLPTQQQPTSTWDSDSDDDWPQEAEEEKKTAQNDDYTSGREDYNYGEEENYSEKDDEYICDDCWEDLQADDGYDSSDGYGDDDEWDD